MADQNQWPEELILEFSQSMRRYIDMDPEDGFKHDPDDYETYVPKAALGEMRSAAKTINDELARIMAAYEKSQAALTSERERAGKARVLMEDGKFGDAHAILEEIRHDEEIERAEIEDREDDAAALSPSPAEGEECERCGGSGKKTHVGTVGHRVTVACSHCHGTGKKQPDPRLGYDLAQRAIRDGRTIRATLSLRRGEVEGTVISIEDDYCLLDVSGIGCGNPSRRLYWNELDGFEILPPDPVPDSNKEADR